MDLLRYNTIILAGNFREWTEADAAKLKDWISDGGTLIACENASEWASPMKLGSVHRKRQANKLLQQYEFQRDLAWNNQAFYQFGIFWEYYPLIISGLKKLHYF